MTGSKHILSLLALVTPVALATPEVSATGSNPNLCDSTYGVCLVVPFDEAPRLDQDVCWDGRTAKLMGTSGCSGRARPYSLGFGFVSDPLTNTVTPLAPVIDTCLAGYCVGGQIDSGEIYEDGVACCNPETGDCSSPDENGVCTFGDITWCKQLVDNGDGTLTCHE